MNRSNLFIIISSVALIIVLIIQVNWILETAQIKEELFNEKANMVLSRTTDALNADQETCRKIGESVDMDHTGSASAKIGSNEARIIDSLFTHYMRFYNFHIDYTFEVIKPEENGNKNVSGLASNFYPAQPGSYERNIEEIPNRNGIQLKLIFPEKRQFIIAEMGIQFITSVVLILVVMVMFWRTMLALLREKRISEHTTEFLNNMTHEFKTPLTNIALAGKMMVKDSSIGHEEKIRHYSGIILEENKKLKLQVEQVLSMTALEKGEIPLQKTELDFHELVITSLKSMSIQIENMNGELKSDLKAGRFVITGDKTHLTNAICNLVDNAIKYSGEKPELSIETSNAGQNLIVVISDKGIGIEKEYHLRVFDKFFRVPTGNVHDVKGFGLGLSYVRKIIELHGGTIELKSEMGSGSAFIITLPYA